MFAPLAVATNSSSLLLAGFGGARRGACTPIGGCREVVAIIASHLYTDSVRNRAGLTDKDRIAQLTRAMRLSGGSVSETARLLGVSRRTVYRWMKAYGVVVTKTTVRVLDGDG
jgi:hypothetical protein